MKAKYALLVVACLASNPVLGQEVAVPLPKDPKAMALLSGAMAAMGGPGLTAVADTSAEITIRSQNGETVSEAPAVLKTLGRRAWRVEGRNARNGAATITNGDWIVARSEDGETQEYPTIAVAEAGNWRLPWLSILADADDPDVEVTYANSEEGGTVHRIRIFRTLRGSPFSEVAKPCEVFLDAQTGLPIKLSFQAHPPQNLRVSIPVEVEYLDYQVLSGVLIPTRIKYSLRGHLVTEILVSRFSINLGPSPSEFHVR